MMSGKGIVTLLFLWAAWRVVKRIRKALLERQAVASPDSEPPGLPDVSTGQSVPLPDLGFQGSLIDRGQEVRPAHRQKRIPVATVADATARSTKRQRLRRAVIWAEILAPPVGLRG